ncbi:sigma-70 family RNA polymerase sigma factor [Lentzea sp. NBRC 102530]|uniref:RNA polymerase sigma factor n=1 Tax=Lentzea sp. NBRC 102530 TaxID=3032201 RepID=UPI0024A1C074|nr:sigma-70 family RNA polymerase sigma factor [Lentzea sp. NBRC 102530]GLY54842.1 hypothetical protein Lesp01_84970 [Lentzea sp. NBRC 102530]
MAGNGSCDDGCPDRPCHHEVGADSRSDSEAPQPEGADEMQGFSFPVCTQHPLAECEKEIKKKTRLLVYHAFSRGNDWHLSEDFAQDVTIRVAKANKTMCEVNSTFCMIALNRVIIEYWRKKHDVITDDPTGGGTELVYEAVGPPWLESLTTATSEALKSLPDRQRQVFIARHLDGKTAEQVSEELKLSVRTVHNYTSLALRTLESLLGDVI